MRAFAVGMACALAAACSPLVTLKVSDTAPQVPASSPTLAQLRRMAAGGRWAQMLEITNKGRELPANRHGESSATFRILALWRSNQPAAAKLAEDALASHAAARRAELLRVAGFHAHGRKNFADAWRILQPAAAGGCGDLATCELAAEVLVALAAMPDWAVQLRAAAPPVDRGSARMRWLSAACSQIAREMPDRAWQALLAEARSNPTDSASWAALLKIAAPVVSAGQGRKLWLDALAAADVGADTLIELAVTPEIAVDRALTVDLAKAAAARPDAADSAFHVLAWAYERTDARQLLVDLAKDQGRRFADAEARLVLVRALLAVRAVADAEQWLAKMGAPTDAVQAALAGELARLKGQKTPEYWRTAPEGDRSLAALIAYQFLRRADTATADRALETAAATPGRGQLTAARLLAFRETKINNRGGSVALRRWLNLLAAASPAGPGLLVDDVEPNAAESRRLALRPDSIRGAGDVAAEALRSWAQAGTATAEMWRKLAFFHVSNGDVASALAAESTAAALAEVELARPPDEAEMANEMAGASPPAFAAWLNKWPLRAGAPQRDQTVAGVRLLRGHMAAAGLVSLQRTFADSDPAALTVREWDELLDAGGAAIVADGLGGKPADPAARPELLIAEATLSARARLEIGQADRAEASLLELASWPGIDGRTLRGPMELAATYGLCRVVAVMAPRVAAEADMGLFRAGIARGLECARRMQSRDIADQLVRATFGPRPEPSRLDWLVQQLALAGFEPLAVKVAESLAQLRPLGEDANHAWARCLLVLGDRAGALALLTKMIELSPRQARLWLRAAELLDDYGLLEDALPFFRGAQAADPDSTRLRARVCVILLRLGKGAEAGEELAAMARLGATDEDYRIALEVARRTRLQKPLLDAVQSVGDADRDLERFRADLAADLGDRATVLAVVRRLRARGSALASHAVEWLRRVGADQQAREIAEDSLSSAEPLGAGDDAGKLLDAAFDVQRNPASGDEALGIARLWVARSADPEFATAIAAQELGRHNHYAEAATLARRFDLASSLQFLCLRAALAFKSGNRQDAALLWRTVAGALAVDTDVRDKIRVSAPRFDGRVSENIRSLAWLVSDIDLARDEATLGQLLDDLQAQVPGSAWVAFQQTQRWLRRERWDLAARELTLAAARVNDWSEDWHLATDRLATDGGESWLAAAAHLPSTSTASDAEQWAFATRTHPWWLSRVWAAADFGGQADGELNDIMAQLAENSVAVRAELATRLSANRQGIRAAQMLGRWPLACAEGLLPPMIRAMAAALSAIQGPEDGKLSNDATQWMDQWLASGRGSDGATQLAAELVRQGHPNLARRAMATFPAAIIGTAQQILQRRLLVAIGTDSDANVVAAAQAFLRGQRSQLTFRNPNEGTTTATDDVLALLAQAGRIDAARALVRALQPGEPQVAAASGLQAGASGAGFAAQVAAWDPAALLALPAGKELPPLEEVLGAVPLAVAVSPGAAEAVAKAAISLGAVPWRTWAAVAETALDFAEVPLAARAEEMATAAGAPNDALACLQLALGKQADVGRCSHGRSLDGLSDGDLADLGLWLAESASDEQAAAMRQQFGLAMASGQNDFLAALGRRHGAMTAAGRNKIAAWMRQTLQEMPLVRRGSLVLAAMEDLGVFGVGEFGAEVTQRALRLDPHGVGHHNNLAYALFLAGRPARETLPHAQQAEYGSAAESAAASLDTLAAIMAQGGDLKAALGTQRRALAAGLAPSAEARTPPGLLLARYAELLLQNGQVAEARAAAAVAMARRADESPARDEISALPRLRLVLKAALRAPSARP